MRLVCCPGKNSTLFRVYFISLTKGTVDLGISTFQVRVSKFHLSFENLLLSRDVHYEDVLDKYNRCIMLVSAYFLTREQQGTEYK